MGQCDKRRTKNCFLACGYKSEESREIATTSESNEEFDSCFLRYVENGENLPVTSEISETSEIGLIFASFRQIS